MDNVGLVLIADIDIDMRRIAFDLFHLVGAVGQFDFGDLRQRPEMQPVKNPPVRSRPRRFAQIVQRTSSNNPKNQLSVTTLVWSK